MASFDAGARALAAWLEATKEPEALPDPAIFSALERASKQLRDERNTGRAKLLEDVALQRTPAETARAELEATDVGRWRFLSCLASGRIVAVRL